MRTITTIACLFSVTLPAIAQQLERSTRPGINVSANSAQLAVDPQTRPEIRAIKVGNNSNVLVECAQCHRDHFVERDAKERPTLKTWLGVVLDELSPAVASQLPLDPGTGLIVEHVTPESPAAKAGLQKHDVLVRLGDQMLIAPKQLQTLVANHKAGDTVELVFLRKGQQQKVTATLATNHPGDGLADSEATINLHGTKIDIDRLFKDLHDTAGSIIMYKKTVFVGPDGNPVTIDSDEIRDKTLKMLQQSGLTTEILDQVKRAISAAQEQVRKAQDQAKHAADQARNAAKEAKTAAERAAQELRRSLDKARPPEQPK